MMNNSGVRNRQAADEKTPLLSEAAYDHRLTISSDVEPIQPIYGHQSLPSHQNDESALPPVIEEIEPEHMLDQAIEGFEYDMTQNEVFITEKECNATNCAVGNEVLRYTVLFFIGFCTGLTAFLIDIAIESLSEVKFRWIDYAIDTWNQGPLLCVPGFIWGGCNAVLVIIASLMVVFLSPVAAGSGIPQIKCYLNGINVPYVMRGVTMVTKAVGVVLSVAGGLTVGKEGPMIHTGAAIAAGLSQGRFTWFTKSFRIFRQFRNDQEKRDFVSAGAAAGVAAAFGAPVGGLLFSLEEGASFVNQRLTWKILFSSMTSMFTLSTFKSFSSSPGKFNPGGLISFGTFENLNSYNVFELLVAVAIGVIGGLLGAIFNKANEMLSKYRKNNVNTRMTKVIEAGLTAFLTAAVGYTLMTYQRDCQIVTSAEMGEIPKMYCSDSEYNAVGSLFFQTPEKTVRALFHYPAGSFTRVTLAIFAPIYFVLACFTYGLSVPSGLFIPCLLCGAAWGRLLGNLLNMANASLFPDPGKFALIGAAAQLGGVVRMTVSLTVILMEATGNIIVGLPLLVTLVVAKFIGDFFNEGIYDLHINLSGMALLPWQPDELSVTKKAFDLMSSPVVYLNQRMRVSELIEKVGNDPHQAFPVIEGVVDPPRHRYGVLMGLISRQHLSLLLKKKIYFPEGDDLCNSKQLTIEDYDEAYPRFPQFKDVIKELTDLDREQFIDLRPYMNEAPYRVPETMTMNRVFYLFRLLGLRHLPVVDRDNQVRGMITRKDLRRFRFIHEDGKVRVEELLFSTRQDSSRPTGAARQ